MLSPASSLIHCSLHSDIQLPHFYVFVFFFFWKNMVENLDVVSCQQCSSSPGLCLTWHCLFVVMAEKVTGLLSLKNTITIYYSLLHYHLYFNNNSHPKNSTYCACKELNYNNRSRYNTLKSNQLFLLGLKRKLRLRMNSKKLTVTYTLTVQKDGRHDRSPKLKPKHLDRTLGTCCSINHKVSLLRPLNRRTN